MPVLEGSVGQGGRNEKHDVACIQAALKAVQGPDRRPLWAGPIDGEYSRHRGQLERAIAGYQVLKRQRPSGRFERAGMVLNQLEADLPAPLKNLQGVRGTGLVAVVRPGARSPADGGIAALKLTEEMKADLRQVWQKAVRATGLPLALRDGPPDPGGRFTVAFTFEGVRFADAGLRLAPEQAPPPRPVIELLRRLGMSRLFHLPDSTRPVLVSTSPLRRASTQLASAPAGPGLVQGRVGAGGAPHDVAAVEAALASINMPGMRNRFWRGGLSGRASAELRQAIRTFQVTIGLPQSGEILPGDETDRRLRAALPSELRGLRGIKGTAEVAVEPAAPVALYAAVNQNRVAEDQRPVLERLAEALRRDTGLRLRLVPARYDSGRLGLNFGATRFFGPRARLLVPGKVPPAIAELVAERARPLGLVLHLELGRLEVTAASGATLIDNGGLPADADFGTLEWNALSSFVISGSGSYHFDLLGTVGAINIGSTTSTALWDGIRYKVDWYTLDAYGQVIPQFRNPEEDDRQPGGGHVGITLRSPGLESDPGKKFSVFRSPFWSAHGYRVIIDIRPQPAYHGASIGVALHIHIPIGSKLIYRPGS
jgi:hypothetical protein